MMKKKFKDALPQLRRIANRVANGWGDEFEIDELVNEAWIKSGHKDEEIDIPLLLREAQLDMIDYVRKSVGRKELKNKRPKYVTNTSDSDSQTESSEDGCSNDFLGAHLLTIDDGSKALEDRDLIDFLLEFPTPKQSEVLRKYFLEQKSLIEIGEELRKLDTTVCNLKKAGLKACREELKVMELL